MGADSGHSREAWRQSSRLGLLAGWLILVLAACGGGGGPVQFNPDETTPTQLTTSDGRITAVIPAGALTGQIELTLTNRSSADANVPGPEGRTLAMAMELTAVDTAPTPVEPEGAGGDGTQASQTTEETGDEIVPAEAIAITFELAAALPPAMSIPIYTFNATSLRYEDAGISAAVSEDGTELAFTISAFGRYAFYSLLPEEIPPPVPTGLALVAASTQVRKLTWTPSTSSLVTGYNLYRSSAGADSFAAVNTEPLTATVFSDEIDSPGAYEYYLTTINPGGLESEPSAVINSPAVDFDLLRSFGSDRLVRPGDIAISAAADRLLVADDGADCVWTYDLDGNYRGRITGYDTVDLAQPVGVAFNPDGDRIYVSDAGRSHVFIYDLNYNEAGLFGTPGTDPGEFEETGALEVVYDPELIGDVVLVLDTQLSRLQTFTGLGVYLDTVAEYGDEDGELSAPGAIHWTGDGGEILISDSANARIQRFNDEYEYDSLFELDEEEDGPLDTPLGLAVDFRGRIYVADSANRRVVVFNDSEEALFHFGADGTLGVEFSETTGPAGVALDRSTGYLYVSDPGDGRIVIFTS
ncbi:hypothetical protein JW859_13545 [bacterium]|nr:hypothetical protein [bacterium]